MAYNIPMQFQVPQFIETEDKVVGPLTIRQFIYVCAGAALCAILFFTVTGWLFAILSVFIMGLSVAFAFIKIDGRPFINIALAAFGFYWKPQIYLWQSEQRTKKEDHPGLGAALEDIAAGLALHKSWENLQTKERISNVQITDRYQVFRRQSGEQHAAKRVDYR